MKKLKITLHLTILLTVLTTLGFANPQKDGLDAISSNSDKKLIELPELNYSEPFTDEIGSMLDIKGKWVSYNHSLATGTEMWIIDFEKIGEEFRVIVNPASAMYSANFVSKVAELQDINDNAIKFAFHQKHVYVPAPPKSSFFKNFLFDMANGVTGLPVGDAVRAIVSDTEEARANNNIPGTTYYYYEFNVKLQGNSLVGTLKTTINKVNAQGQQEELRNDVTPNYVLYRVPNQYLGSKRVVPVEEKKKEKNSTLKKLYDETCKAKSKDANGDATNNLGFLYLNGLGIKANQNTAVGYFKEAAKKGNSMAMCNMATYMKQMVEKDKKMLVAYTGSKKEKEETKIREKEKEILRWYEKAVDAGDAHAAYGIGRMYLLGFYIERDTVKGIEWLERAEKLGSKDATNTLGLMYLKNFGSPVNYQKAIEHFELAASSGNPNAMVNLGNMYLNGLGVEKNAEKALEYYYMGARCGLPEALFAIAWLYFKGEALPQNYIEGKKWSILANTLLQNELKGLSTLAISINDIINL